MLLLLWFALPSTPVLSTFGYPSNPEVVNQPRLLLPLLQNYNRAIVRTTDVVFWAIFILVWGVLLPIYYYAKILTAERHQPTPPQP